MPNNHPDLGEEAWLRYRPLPTVYAQTVRTVLGEIELAPELASTSPEITRSICDAYQKARYVFLGERINQKAQPLRITHDPILPAEHFRIECSDGEQITICASDANGALFGLFHLFHRIQLNDPIDTWPTTDGPKVALRLLNHWDNVYPKVDIERGYGGETLFKWDQIPGNNEASNATIERLNAYARLLASVGINGLILNNVNVGATGSQLLRLDWLPKVAQVAAIFRAWGISVGLSSSYAAPVLLGELTSSDPREVATRTWWQERTAAVYQLIPDFLGYLVKADSEGQPGPMDFGLNHAEGAQHLADALAPHGGRVFWRAFVYGHDHTDIMAQPYQQFKPLDGKFAANVTLQVKNGPRDFQVREPIHPLIGAMQQTPTAVEFQITQEYLGHDQHICFLPSQWEEILRQPAQEYTTTADFLIEHAGTALVAVANTNDAPNWTGHLFAQSNLYGFARLAWNPKTSAETIAADWAALTFDNQPEAIATSTQLLLESWPTLEGYTAPNCLGQLYNQADTWDADHFDPSPWTNNGKGWFLADAAGVGIDRSPQSESGLLAQYPAILQQRYADSATCPEDYLLFFHHLPWDWKMQNGQTLIQHLYDSYHDSAQNLDTWLKTWTDLYGKIDTYRHAHVLERLNRQRYHARLWARYMTSYLLSISKVPDDSGRSYT